MSRETRLNLIVLAILLVVLTPGGVMLFRKKLQPSVRPMFMPHAVQQEVAYLSPLETPPGKQRVEPPHTAKWIESLVRERIGDRQVVRPTDADGLPLMSQKKTFQVLAVDAADRKLHLWVVEWVDVDETPSAWSLTPTVAGESVDVVESARVPVPQMVREELGETGVTRPPHEIRCIQIHFSPPPLGEDIRLTRAREGLQDIVNFVPSFTNSAATGN